MSAESRDDPTSPDLEARSDRHDSGVPAHFAARCADVEEFIVSFQAFVDDDTLVLPQHPFLSIGGEHDFVIRLRGAGAVMLRGRCRGLELMSDGRSFRRANRAVRVQVLEIDQAFRSVHDRLRSGRFPAEDEDPRLARLQMLLQVVAPPPRPREPLPLQMVPPPQPVPLPVVAPPPRPRETVAPLRPISPLRPPPPVERIDAPPRSVTRTSALLPVLEFAPPRSSVRRWTDETLRRSAALLALLRRHGTRLVPVVRRHAKVILVGVISFALGLAARGRSRPEPPRLPPLQAAAAVVEAPRPAAIEPRPRILDDPQPVVRVSPVHIVPGSPRRPHRR